MPLLAVSTPDQAARSNSMVADLRPNWTSVVWRSMVVVDVLLIALFGIIAAVDPEHALDVAVVSSV
ncbi:hypothetical protein GCM10010411_53900 [Actinomadura fulvescens]|uniref:Uncharacterized protein n=1 Tax=Actinomadura fulvescens TaxID=46160 RepID=A0ABN3Q4V8_9ACTN